ncbi:F0F1 ATP synthase subunit gamma [Lentzea flaviverrucosa]|uniref:ATP synthase gamma chain n=1 Tax=Lentzea flaviverrucosa TaxID=200379 RepID=A0A1H9RLQ5_9PSEU|nr:F0F1 ATP synthase subunit gamma [Lentzea flaviverrucosa]RDI33056.1 ATP synthase F1 subcomplex gamma subunit [Lentzea flaviverrucosa]SER73475.1 F-type H+-transporting ATPase subunit gamma [Lentzea flaviverrucosa]
MGAQIRELRQRIRTVNSTKKITKAYELIATSRLAKAQTRVAASRPYADEITNVLSALAEASANLDHPLLSERENPKRAAVLVVTSDKGMCGGYNANVLKAAEQLIQLLKSEGKEPVLYATGRKAIGYYNFRRREVTASWSGFSQTPHYVNAVEAGDALVEAFLEGTENGAQGVDEIHVVYTEFKSMLSQTPTARRIAPMDVEYTGETPKGPRAVYDFEPSAEALLGAMLPKYVKTRLFSAMLEAAASESAARRTAMKAATDNATELVRNLSRAANSARQAQITQEISEIVGGASALTGGAGSDD